MPIILITGGSGLIGGALTKALQADGQDVRWLSRTAAKGTSVPTYAWDTDRGVMDTTALDGVEHIIHLSGAGIAEKRWTPSRLKELHASRGGAARMLLKAACERGSMPRSFISASGTGYYGTVTRDHWFKEEDPAANDTIGRLTEDWERAADEWAAHCRVVKLRTPVVLARDGVAVRKLSGPARWGLAAPIGSGRQWMPWVHIDDLVSIYRQAVNDERMRGAYNVNATEQPRNKDFMRAIAKALHRPFFLPNVPAFALRLVFGEMSSILLEGSRASNARLLDTGSRFKHDTLDNALRDTLGDSVQ